MDPLQQLRVVNHPEADVANDLPTETLFQFSQNFDLGDLFQLIVQGGLKDLDIQNSLVQRHHDQ